MSRKRRAHGNATPEPAGDPSIRGRSNTPLLSFDAGVLVAAAVLAWLVPGPKLLGLVSLSGLGVLSTLTAAMLPFAMMRLHQRITANPDSTYVRAVALTTRVIGFFLVLGTLFVVPLNLAHWRLVPGFLDDLLFVAGLLAMLGGVLAGYGDLGAGIMLTVGATLFGLVFCLPADLSAWLAGSAVAPVAGALSLLTLVVVLVFTGRFIGRMEELSTATKAWLDRASGRFAARTALPFLGALAFSFWNVAYVDLFVARHDPFWAIPALLAMGIIPYRLVLALAPPVRPLPLATGLLAVAATLVNASR